MSAADDRVPATEATPPAPEVTAPAPEPTVLRPSQFTVWLRQGFNPPDETLLSNVATKVISQDGSHRLCLRCATLDLSHGYYLEADCFPPAGEGGLISIKIPHQLVVLIIGDDPQRPLGFAVE